MVQTIKDLWNSWKTLKTWQQVLLLLPFIILTIVIILYIFSPIKSEEINKQLVKHSKKTSDDHLDTIEHQDNVIVKAQEKVRSKRRDLERKISDKEHEANNILKDIDRADDNIDQLISLHKRLNSRKRN
jgi:peptidoglycan hydrolase CwlO-like protein